MHLITFLLYLVGLAFTVSGLGLLFMAVKVGFDIATGR